MQQCMGAQWVGTVRDRLRQTQPMSFVSTTFGPMAQRPDSTGDQQPLDLRDLLQCVTRLWDIFRNVLRPSVRSACSFIYVYLFILSYVKL